MMFIVRHEAFHDALWTAWLDSVNGLLPAAAVQEACCGRGRRGWLRRQRRLKSRRRSALVRQLSDTEWLRLSIRAQCPAGCCREVRPPRTDRTLPRAMTILLSTSTVRARIPAERLSPCLPNIGSTFHT